jgi:hypothetical protein
MGPTIPARDAGQERLRKQMALRLPADVLRVTPKAVTAPSVGGEYRDGDGGNSASSTSVTPLPPLLSGRGHTVHYRDYGAGPTSARRRLYSIRRSHAPQLEAAELGTAFALAIHDGMSLLGIIFRDLHNARIVHPCGTTTACSVCAPVTRGNFPAELPACPLLNSPPRTPITVDGNDVPPAGGGVLAVHPRRGGGKLDRR